LGDLFKGFDPKSLVEPMQQLGQVLLNLSPGVGTFQALSRHAQELGKWFTTSVVPALQKAKPGFDELLKAGKQLWPIFQQISQVLHDSLQKAFDALLPVFEKAVPVVIKFAGVLANLLGKAIQFLAPY